MSRIHEALKKAAEERAAITGVETPVEIPADPTALTAAAPRAVPAHPPVDLSTLPLTLERLREGCTHPRWTPDAEKMIFFGSHGHTPGTEELRTLRSRLYQLRDRAPLKTVLITSALPAEGKSFIASNLAQVIVRQHERHALLIDADLRWSRLHLNFGAPAGPGLTDYLSGEASLFDVVQQSPQENLFFIPGGKAASNPAELISNGRLKKLLDQCSPLFDWIILDSPPVVPVADASTLADMCDGVLLVVRAASTPADMAQKARTEFRDKGLLGVVFNQIQAGEGYHSYYYHYYGDKAKNGSKSK